MTFCRYIHQKIVWHFQLIQGFHMCVHYECFSLTESIISPVLRDGWTLTPSCPMSSGFWSYLSSGLGISSEHWFQFYHQWLAAHRLFAPLLQGARLQVSYHCHVSHHHHAEKQFQELWLILTLCLHQEQLRGSEVTDMIWAMHLWNCWPWENVFK